MQFETLKWNIININDENFDLNISQILDKRFLEWDFKKTIDDLHDPYLFLWMKEAVSRIKEAHKNKERVAIFWDYDVDWVTSTSILVHFFHKIWVEVTYRLPHRIADWYWLKDYFIDELKEKWVTLVITVDCWTKDVDVIKNTKQKWVDVIVTDHHSVPEKIPEEAVCVINPKREDCTYPYKWLCWAGVAFKLMQALSYEFFDEQEAKNYIKSSIDIAAIWTVADCMDLTWENRIIVDEGLKQLKKSRSRWLRKIIEDHLDNELDGDIFWFQIWPRLNAAWRMDTPYKAINLILNNSVSVFDTLQEIEKLNNARKEQTLRFCDDAVKKVDFNQNILFYSSKEIWHWIIWIVAWRLTENHYKPSIVFKDEWDKLVWSSRSPDYFNMIEFLDNFKDLFLAYWWHKQAAGFSVSKENFEILKESMINYLKDHNFSTNKKIINVEKVLSPLDISFSFLSEINRYKPYWMGNLKPLFLIEDFPLKRLDFLWKWELHLKFWNNLWLKVIGFNIWELYQKIKDKDKIGIVFSLWEDNYMWKKSIQLQVIDIV